MGISDLELDRITAALDRGDVVNACVIRDLVEEVRADRVSLGLASDAVGMISQAAMDQAENARNLVDQYREAAADNGEFQPVITMDWPGGFSPPRGDV